MPVTTSITTAAGSIRDRAEHWMFDGPRALRAAAACRIATGLAVLGLLLDNFSSRDIWVGPAAVWAEPARSASSFLELNLLDGVSSDVLFVVYVATMLSALAFVLGWHVKGANLVLLIGFIAIVGQNPVVGGQSDNLLRLTLLWLLLMRTSERWSLDAWLAQRRADAGEEPRRWDGRDALPAWLSTGLHHIGLLGLGLQTVLLYTSAGLDKIAEPGWRDGTALYSTMQLPDYRPFPSLSDTISGSSLLLGLATYAVLLVQLFFAPLLLSTVGRRLVVALAVVVNLVLAVLFAQLWASLAVIGVTCLFVSDVTFERFDDTVRDRLSAVSDWIAMRWYDVLDAVDEVRARTGRRGGPGDHQIVTRASGSSQSSSSAPTPKAS